MLKVVLEHKSKIFIQFIKFFHTNELEEKIYKKLDFKRKIFQSQSLFFANIIGLIILISLLPQILQKFYNIKESIPYVIFLFLYVYLLLSAAFIVHSIHYFYSILSKERAINNEKWFSKKIILASANLIILNYITTVFENISDNYILLLIFSMAYINMCVLFNFKQRILLLFSSMLLFVLFFFNHKEHLFFEEIETVLIVFKMHFFFFILGFVIYRVWFILNAGYITQKLEIKDLQKEKENFENIIYTQNNSILKISDSLHLDFDKNDINIHSLEHFKEIEENIKREIREKDKIQLAIQIYKDILNDISNAFLIKDENFKVIFSNNLAKEFFNIEKGSSLDSIILEEYRKDYEAHIYNLKMGKKSIFKGKLFTSNYKKNLKVIIRSIPIFKNNTFVGTTDILSFKDQNNTNYSTDNFNINKLINLNHELRTPINEIISIGQVLNESEHTKSDGELIDKLNSISKDLSNKIDNILFSLDTKKDKKISKLKQIKLIPFLNKNFEPYYKKAQENNLKFIFDYPKTFSDSNFILDTENIIKILNNLVNNAFKYTKKGFISVSINNTIIQKNNQSFITFYVKDSGIGIAKNDINNIFDTKINKNTKNNRGLGLSLSVTKKILDALGGEISVKSIENDGSFFRFTYPIQKISNALEKTYTPSEITYKNNTPKINVLIVEDNLLNQKYLTILFQKWNITYMAVNNGEEAIKRIDEALFDVIFMDINMPIKNGFETAYHIKNSDSINKETPIYALTADALLEQKNKAKEIGMSGFITKPFMPNDIKKIIEKYIRIPN